MLKAFEVPAERCVAGFVEFDKIFLVGSKEDFFWGNGFGMAVEPVADTCQAVIRGSLTSFKFRM